MRTPLRWIAGLLAGTWFSAAGFAQEPPARAMEEINRAFLEHVKARGAEHARAIEIIEKNARENAAADSLIPDSLAVLYPAFGEALRAFDDQRYAEAVEKLNTLRGQADPYLAANAAYFQARALIEQGLSEEAEDFLKTVMTPEAKPERYTPYAPHLWFLKGVAEAGNLRYDAALKSLRHMLDTYAAAPEAVAMGAKQLLLELERREQGNLEEVAGYMGYSATRLKASDAAQRVRETQDQAVALLNKLIKEAEEREKSQCQSGGKGRSSGRGGRKGASNNTPRAPAEESSAPPGAGRVGDLHAAGKADPGEMWGKLPPAEREKVLQALRERFPSRYRQLVEQYYRSLAEQK